MIYSFVANARKSVDHKREEYRLKTLTKIVKHSRKKRKANFILQSPMLNSRRNVTCTRSFSQNVDQMFFYKTLSETRTSERVHIVPLW